MNINPNNFVYNKDREERELINEVYNVVDVNIRFPIQNKSILGVILLIILAILDSTFTDFGLRNNYITEANPLMRILYEKNLFGFYAIKICFPILLLYVITKIEPKKYLTVFIGFTLFLYIFVMFQHIWWISLLLL